MTETTDRKPRRSAKEIAQAHADRAVAAVEKHDEKEGKLEAKLEKLRDELDALAVKREALVREADYRQAHPLLQEESSTEGAKVDIEPEPKLAPEPEPESKDDGDDYNPFD